MTSGEKLSKGISLFADGLTEIAQDIAKNIQEAFDILWPKINPILEQKFTKKKFKNMLQSYGKQRNEINRIMANTKAPYTRKKLMGYLTAKDIKRKGE